MYFDQKENKIALKHNATAFDVSGHNFSNILLGASSNNFKNCHIINKLTNKVML